MENFINFLIDWLFYSFIEGLIMYVYTLKFCNIKLPKLPKIIINTLMISIGSALCSRFIPIIGLSQLIWLVYTFLFLKFTLKVKILKIIFSILIIFMDFSIVECCLNILFYNINFNILSMNLNSIHRLSAFVVSKILEIVLLPIINKVFFKEI